MVHLNVFPDRQWSASTRQMTRLCLPEGYCRSALIWHCVGNTRGAALVWTYLLQEVELWNGIRYRKSSFWNPRQNGLWHIIARESCHGYNSFINSSGAVQCYIGKTKSEWNYMAITVACPIHLFILHEFLWISFHQSRWWRHRTLFIHARDYYPQGTLHLCRERTQRHELIRQ